MSIKSRKLQVFVSSTFLDLQEERQAAVEAILSTGNIPAGMELFAAGDQSQMEVIKEWIRDSDVYLLILGGRYGSIEPLSGKSYTHLEYEYALEIGKPHFVVVASDTALDAKVQKGGKSMTEHGSEKYSQFNTQVTGTKLVAFWNDIKDIKLQVHESLSYFSKREELIGCIPGDQAVNSGALDEELARLDKENAELRDMISQMKSVANENIFNGLNFEEFYLRLDAKHFNIIRTEKDRAKYFPLSKYNFKHIYPDNVPDLITANDFLMITHGLINGHSQFHHPEIISLFEFLQQHGMIRFSNLNNRANNGIQVVEFTDMGRRYFYKLSDLPKYNVVQNVKFDFLLQPRSVKSY